MEEIHRNNDPSTSPGGVEHINPEMFQGNLQAFKRLRGVPVVVILSLLASSCQTEDGSIPSAEIQASETQPRVTEVFQTETPTIVPTATNTPEPEIVCPEYPLNILFSGELAQETGMMVPVMSVEDITGSFLDGIPAGLFEQVASGIADTIRANPGSINRIVYPEYLQRFDGSDMQTRVMEKLAVYGILESDVNMVPFSRDNQQNLSGENTIWIVVHAGAGGVTTVPWKNARVEHRQDENQTARILGDMMIVTDLNGDGILELRTLPGSQLYGSPDIAQVPGCGPVVIQTTPDGLRVIAVLEDEPDFSDPNTLWAVNPDEEVAAEVTLEPYTRFEELRPLLTEEEQREVVSGLIERYGPTWDALKRFDTRDNKWRVMIASEGEYINLIDRPLRIPISETENVNLLVGIRGYYPDNIGQIQSVIVPIVMELPDGRFFYNGGPIRDRSVDWSRSEIMERLNELNTQCNTCIGEDRGSDLAIYYFEDVIEAFSDMGGDFESLSDEIENVYFLRHIIIPWTDFNADNFSDFTETGDPNIGIFVAITTSG